MAERAGPKRALDLRVLDEEVFGIQLFVNRESKCVRTTKYSRQPFTKSISPFKAVELRAWGIDDPREINKLTIRCRFSPSTNAMKSVHLIEATARVKSFASSERSLTGGGRLSMRSINFAAMG